MIESPQFQSFLRHWDELRSRILKCLGLFLIAAFVCYNYAETVLLWFIKPAGHLIFTTPSGGFSAVLSVTFLMAFLICAPFIFYQVWAFVASALKSEERRSVFIFGPLSLVFFLSGVAFAFYAAVPTAYKFLMGFSSPEMTAMITVDNYMGFMGNMLLACGLTFQLPLILGFFAKIGIATPEFLRQKRKHAIVAILIAAALLSPSPDVISQMVLALPLVGLYELGIVFTKVFYKTQNPLIRSEGFTPQNN